LGKLVEDKFRAARDLFARWPRETLFVFLFRDAPETRKGVWRLGKRVFEERSADGRRDLHNRLLGRTLDSPNCAEAIALLALSLKEIGPVPLPTYLDLFKRVASSAIGADPVLLKTIRMIGFSKDTEGVRANFCEVYRVAFEKVDLGDAWRVFVAFHRMIASGAADLMFMLKHRAMPAILKAAHSWTHKKVTEAFQRALLEFPADTLCRNAILKIALHCGDVKLAPATPGILRIAAESFSVKTIEKYIGLAWQNIRETRDPGELRAAIGTIEAIYGTPAISVRIFALDEEPLQDLFTAIAYSTFPREELRALCGLAVRMAEFRGPGGLEFLEGETITKLNDQGNGDNFWELLVAVLWARHRSVDAVLENVLVQVRCFKQNQWGIGGMFEPFIAWTDPERVSGGKAFLEQAMVLRLYSNADMTELFEAFRDFITFEDLKELVRVGFDEDISTSLEWGLVDAMFRAFPRHTEELKIMFPVKAVKRSSLARFPTLKTIFPATDCSEGDT
jgi:hypothetical protein